MWVSADALLGLILLSVVLGLGEGLVIGIAAWGAHRAKVRRLEAEADALWFEAEHWIFRVASLTPKDDVPALLAEIDEARSARP